MMTEGCGDDGKSHCQGSELEKAIDAQKLAKLKRRTDEQSCRNGNYARCSGFQGLQFQITISAGLPTDIENMKGQNLDPLFFYGLSFVFDKHGGFQVYGLTRDQKFDPYYNPGPADQANEMSYAGAGISIAGGLIHGSEFAAKGTSAYAGRSVDATIGIGPISVDHYELFDENSGTTDGTKVSGDDIGISFGTIVSGGAFAVNAHPWFPRIGPAIQDPWAE